MSDDAHANIDKMIVEWGDFLDLKLIDMAADLGVDITKELDIWKEFAKNQVTEAGNEIASGVVVMINKIRADAARAYKGVSGGRYRGQTAEEIQTDVFGGGASAGFMAKLGEALQGGGGRIGPFGQTTTDNVYIDAAIRSNKRP